MPKKFFVFTSLLFLVVSTTYALSIESASSIPPRKSSETIEEYKIRVRAEKQQYIEEYKKQLQEQKQLKVDGIGEADGDEVKTREQVRERVCENIEEKIDLRVARFEENKDTHVEKYNRLKERLSGILTSLQDKGYDVDELSDDLVELEELILDYAQAYSDFIDSLIFTRGFSCGESEGDFRDSLRESKELLVLVKQKRAAIRDFYKDVIRKDIKELRQQAEEIAQSEGTETDSLEMEDNLDE